MPFGVSQTVAPASDAVTFDIAKKHLRVTWSDDDDLIRAFLAGAIQSAQRESGRQLVTATLRLTLDDFPRDSAEDGCGVIRLPVGPVVAVDSVEYQDAAGAWQTVAASDYSVGLATGRILPLAGWPTVYAGLEAVRVTYRAGYGTTADVPAEATQAVLLILADRYTHRGDGVGAADRPIPAGALRLLRGLSDGAQW